MAGEQVAGVRFVVGYPAVEGLICRLDRLVALHVSCQPRLYIGIDPLGQDAHVFTEPVQLDRLIALQRRNLDSAFVQSLRPNAVPAIRHFAKPHTSDSRSGD